MRQRSIKPGMNPDEQRETTLAANQQIERLFTVTSPFRIA
jgi:hypothetical protein